MVLPTRATRRKSGGNNQAFCKQKATLLAAAGTSLGQELKGLHRHGFAPVQAR